jgi:hypothetical protein
MKQLILNITILVIFLGSNSVWSQGNPPTFIGVNLNISGVTLEGHYDPVTGQVNSNFGVAPRISSDSLVYGRPPFKDLKWGNYIGSDIVGSNINLHEIDDWMLVQLISVQGQIKATASGLLVKGKGKKGGKIINPRNGDALHVSVATGDYYIKVIHLNSISVLSRNPIHIEGNSGNHYFWDFSVPESVWGKNALKDLGNGRYGLYTGDAVPIDFVGLRSWIAIYNNNGETGYTNNDLDANSNVDIEDQNLNLNNWYSSFQSPWSKRSIDGELIGPDNMIQLSTQGTIPYELKADNFILGSGLAGQALTFDITLTGNFIFGGFEFMIKFDTTILNGGIGHVTLLQPFTTLHNIWIDGDKIKGVIVTNQSDNDSISESGTLLGKVQLTTESQIFSSVNGMSWYNRYTNVAAKENGVFVVITDTTHHIFENSLTNIHAIDDEIALNYNLYQNYPNPFNPTTTLQYSVPIDAKVNLQVYDITGKMVAEVVNEQQVVGVYSIRFDGSNLSSGIYYYQLTVGNVVETKKMMLLK